MTTVTALLLVLALLAGMSLMLEVGLHVGRRHIEEEKGAFNEGFGAVENAVFALLGLLLAFTFSGAAERYDARRNLIVQEANAVGTVLLRFDLLPDDARRELRELLASYVSARNAAYEARNEQSVAGLKESVYQGLQKDIWTRTLAALESDAP
ncbi:MAG: DUF4239 domain-containing protein, partial [Candidatus Competibacter sp.]|nr:DUF4239 domain-containing protein [Candidatus Competibacter sp.]